MYIYIYIYIYIFSYTLNCWLRNLITGFTLINCLFGSAKLTKNAHLDKNKYSSYGIGFDTRSEFSFIDRGFVKNVIIFGADMNSSVHIGNRGKDILILGEGSTQGLDNTTLTSEAKYPINFTQSGKRFVLNLPYNGSNSSLFVNATEVYQFKAKNSLIMKKTGLKGVVKFFVGFNPIITNDIFYIHKNLMKRT